MLDFLQYKQMAPSAHKPSAVQFVLPQKQSSDKSSRNQNNRDLVLRIFLQTNPELMQPHRERQTPKGLDYLLDSSVGKIAATARLNRRSNWQLSLI
jgi:hypothetical protein